MQHWPQQHARTLRWIVLLCAPMFLGCATYRWPRIDPSGQSVLIFPEQQATTAQPLAVAPPQQLAVPFTLPQDPCAPGVVGVPGQPFVQPGVAVPFQPMPGQPSAPVYTQPPPIATSPQPFNPAPGTSVPQLPGNMAMLSLQVLGPATGTVGQPLTYQITLTNSGNDPVGNVVVSHFGAPGLSYVNSNPPAEIGSNPARWQLGTVGGRETRTINVEMRADAPGTYNYCASATSSNGQQPQHCATTTVTAGSQQPSSVRLNVQGPDRARVGEEVRFEIQVTNTGTQPAADLVIQDTLEAGFEHSSQVNQITNRLGTLASGETRTLGLSLKVTQPGTLRHVVELHGPNGLIQSQPVFLVASQAPVGPSVRLSIRSQRQANIGDRVEFIVDIVNTGTEPISELTLNNHIHASLEPTDVSDGYHRPSPNVIQWYIHNLAPNESQARAMILRCLSTAPSACVRAELTTPSGSITLADEACIQISPAGTGR